VESPRYHRYHKQPDLSFFCAVGRATVVHRGRDLVEHSKLAPRGELGKKMVFGTVVYMPLLTPDLMRHTFLFAQPITECMVRITPTLSSWKSCLSTTTCPKVARIVQQLESTAILCSTAWDIHDLLQLPAKRSCQHSWISITWLHDFLQ